MMDMFVKCRALRSLNVSSFDTSNVKDMDGMFECCESLATIDIANFDTSKVTDMSMMFYRCTSITSLDLSSFDTASVTRMFAMFERDSSLSTIYVSNAWTVDAVTDSDKMFGDCYSLRGDRSYDSSVIDKTYATASGGYLTLKASTQSIKLNVDQSGTVNGYTEQRVA